jgi:hypothetical protein
MTEQEWLGCDDAHEMLQFLRLGSQIDDRKLRLLGCACARLVWVWAGDEPPPIAIERAERFADGLFTKAGLRRARQEVRKMRYDMQGTEAASRPIWGAYWLVEVVATENAYGSVITEMYRLTTSLLFLDTSGWSTVCRLLHDVVGNPSRPVAIPTAWRTPTVVSLATAAYEERSLPSGELDPARLAVLSDALEDAGCDSNEILAHLRGPGPHVRGCWVLDRLLGKE